MGLLDWLFRRGKSNLKSDATEDSPNGRGTHSSQVATKRSNESSIELARPEADQLCRQAVERAEKGELDLALELCNQALGLDRELAGAYGLRCQLHYSMNRWPEAAADCSAAIDRGLRLAEIYFIRAVVLNESRQAEETEADCSIALEIDPQHAGAYNFRGLMRARLGRSDEALKDYSDAIRLAPNWFAPYIHRAELQRSRGKLDPALVDFDKAIELVKNVSPKMRQGEGEHVLAMLHCTRGETRYDRFDEDDAEADFAEAARQNLQTAANHLAEMWMRRHKYPKALEQYDRLINLRPESAQGYLNRGTVKEAMADLEQAEADYSEAIRLQPDGTPGYLLRGRVRHRLGRYDDALMDLSDHLRLHPQDVEGYLTRAALHGERATWPAAFEDLNAAYRIAPNSQFVCNSLAWKLATCPDAQHRDGPRAIALARQACEATAWETPYFLDTLAAAYAETGAFEEAVRWQTKAVALSLEEMKAARESRLKLYQAGQACRED
ncbi:MAG TPA: tetratricopeptide repeat protein [Gemmataceae bacterium]|jgi:tetratricopeptide (TPR) repeat protein|nr:tetratricopeptide repeat protein [Gemmataceae bacterium]